MSETCDRTRAMVYLQSVASPYIAARKVTVPRHHGYADCSVIWVAKTFQ